MIADSFRTRSPRLTVSRLILGATMLVATPLAAVAETSVGHTPSAPGPGVRLLVNGVAAPPNDAAKPSAMATPSRRTRFIIGGSFAGRRSGRVRWLSGWKQYAVHRGG